MYKCQVAAHYHKADRSRTANETVVCVFDVGVVKGSALTKQREQKHSAGGVSGLLFSRAPGPSARVDLFGGKKKCRGQMAD